MTKFGPVLPKALHKNKKEKKRRKMLFTSFKYPFIPVIFKF